MKTPTRNVRINALAIAVQGALLAMYAAPTLAEDDTVAALTTPDNFVEAGVAATDKRSNKFGEYSGLNKNDAYAVGNFSVKGGDYGSETGTTRWSVTGSNLGLTSRELGASFSNQGLWNVGVGYDELRHNTTDGYQTPYQGSMGGNSFTLPAGFGTVAATGAGTTAMSASQQAAMHTVDVNNTRKNTSLSAGYFISPQWRVTFDYNNLEQSGAKLMAFGADGHGGGTGERIAVLPNPTNYTTDTLNLGVDWIGEKGHLTAAYFGSFFRDHNDQVTWTTFVGANVTDTMSTAPSNQLHQLNLSGGYKFADRTKLTGGLSFGRNTQDSNFVGGTSLAAASGLMVTAAPASSLNGVVATTHADLKLIDQTTKDLKLSAGVKYDKRDNQTDSRFYNANAIDGGNPYNYPNTPYSYSKAQFETAGDYRLDARQHVRLVLGHDDMKRWCNDYASGLRNYTGASCVTDTGTKEDKLGATYKLTIQSGIDFRAGYAYSDRKTTYDVNARGPFIGTKGSINYATGAVSATANGINEGDYPGFHPIFDASRIQQAIKLGVNWQATDALSFGANSRFTDDNYRDMTYGAQNGKSWGLNLDGAFTYSENGSVFAYISQDYRDRYVTHINRSTTTGYIWGDKLKDQSITYGLGFKQGGLLSGKFDLAGDLSYSDAKSNYSTDYLTWIVGTTTATSCAAANALSCGSAPDMRNKLTQLKLTGSYKVDKQNKVALGYVFQKLSSTDYFYNGYQYGYTPTGVMASNQQSGSYKVNLVAATYIYTFK
jgi:MtrB/PioB family decaheme-associated outer membrane protein